MYGIHIHTIEYDTRRYNTIKYDRIRYRKEKEKAKEKENHKEKEKEISFQKTSQIGFGYNETLTTRCNTVYTYLLASRDCVI